MPRYYEVEVSLQEVQPRIWRRFLLRTTATFAQLHQAIHDDPEGLTTWLDGWRPDAFELATAKAKFDR